MSKLEQLYQAIKTLKELGVTIQQELLEETNRVEEQIIKDDVIPALANAISPLIEQIQRSVILVVDYTPNEPVEVKWSSKKRVSNYLLPEEAPFAKDESFTGKQSFTISHHNKSAKSKLSVRFDGGKVISHHFAKDTLVDTIQKIGAEKVMALNMICSGVPLVGKIKDDFYSQVEIEKGVYVMTHSSTKSKKEQLDEIAKRLGVSLKVEIV